ncbi:hypothetical protein DPEC_G00344610 [Dallia pectoralis]|uniref:Uncharacterized protein n=1 Tax=Dallia pectoralis TaxID=75939 RepID=A0ACC2F3C7_DALPE|nr:hypothetical protein DPEC_G00344610 [Dallia pectoralis]
MPRDPLLKYTSVMPRYYIRPGFTDPHKYPPSPRPYRSDTRSVLCGGWGQGSSVTCAGGVSPRGDDRSSLSRIAGLLKHLAVSYVGWTRERSVKFDGASEVHFVEEWRRGATAAAMSRCAKTPPLPEWRAEAAFAMYSRAQCFAGHGTYLGPWADRLGRLLLWRPVFPWSRGPVFIRVGEFPLSLPICVQHWNLRKVAQQLPLEADRLTETVLSFFLRRLMNGVISDVGEEPESLTAGMAPPGGRSNVRPQRRNGEAE